MVEVVITGMGAVTACGRGVGSLMDAFHNGRCGISALEEIASVHGKTRAAQVKDSAYSGPLRLSAMAVDAIEEALGQSGLPFDEGAPVALYVATTAGESRALEDRFDDYVSTGHADGELREAIARFPNHALGDAIAARFGFRGVRDVNTNACASGNVALARALVAMRAGQIRRAVVIGADQLKTSMYWGAERAGFIGHDLRPFHQDRDGSILGDGAAALVLERYEDAAARGAEMLATVAGWGMACDENPQTIVPQLDGGASARAMIAALRDAGLAAEHVDYFNAHGTGTLGIDRVETLAAKQVFGARAYEIPISATKSFTGHLSSASAIVEAIACVVAIRHGYIHPTLKLDRVAPDLDLDYVANDGRQATVRCALSNSMGGGGSNSVVAFTRPGFPRAAAQPQEEEDVIITGCGLVASDAEPLDLMAIIGEDSPLQFLSRTAVLALLAGQRAGEEARLALPLPASSRVAVILGTAFGGTPEWSDLLCRAIARNPKLITPRMALDHGSHLGTTLVARAFGVTGPTCTLTGGTPAGLQAIGFARDLVLSGACDVAFALGADVIDEPLARGLRLATGRDVPRRDAAAAVVIERAGHAAARGARALARMTGFDTSSTPAGVCAHDDGVALQTTVDALLRGQARSCALIHATDGTSRSESAARALGAGASVLAPRDGAVFAAGGVAAAVAAVRALAGDISRPFVVTASGAGGVAASLRVEAPR